MDDDDHRRIFKPSLVIAPGTWPIEDAMTPVTNPSGTHACLKVALPESGGTRSAIDFPSRGSRVTFSTLDAWRGFAALWVVMDHASLETVSLRLPQLRHNPLYAFSIAGMLGVQIFFVISGFCIANAAVSAANRDDGVTRFVWARLRRIYPPYFFALLAMLAMTRGASWLLSRGYIHSSHTADKNLAQYSMLFYISQLTLTQVPLRQDPLVTVFWTLCYEISFYAVVAAMLLLARSALDRQRRLLDALHLLTLGSMAVLIAMPSWCPFPMNLWPQFGMGVLVFDLLKAADRWPRVVAVALTIEIILFALFRDYGGDAWHLGSRVTFLAAGLFAAVLLATYRIDAPLYRVRVVRALSVVGTFSYSLYLIHLLALGGMMQLGRSQLTTPNRFFVFFFLQIGVAVLTAYPFFWLCERPFLSRRAAAHVRTVTHEADIANGLPFVEGSEAVTA